ncbi:MAG: preprotein translocase subunit YajC [Alphaproteobacteria bacterium]|nr:preprotein translocase subunit YajC [Alphaproteobacteria bacterium]
MNTLFDLLISPANAQAAPGPLGFDFMSLLPLVLIFAVFYFFLIRPQQKKAQQQKTLLSSLKRGDRILTNGGLIGTVTKVISEQELEVEIADSVKVRIARPMVADLLLSTETPREVEPRKEKEAVTKLSSRKTVAPKKKSSK